MAWITDLLKYLKVARSAVAAAFVTAVVLYFGPKYFPDHIDPVSAEWRPALVGTAVFCGFLLALWVISAMWAFVASVAGFGYKAYGRTSLSDDEQVLIWLLSHDPSSGLNLDRVEYEHLSISKLAMMEVARGLAEKGLVDRDMYSGNIVSLTSEGRQRALKLQRAIGSPQEKVNANRERP